MKNRLPIVLNSFFSFRKILLLFFVAILSGFIILSVLFYSNNNSYHNTAYWVAHIHTVLEQAIIVSSLSKDLQWETRNYILTGDSNTFNAYYNVKAALKAGSTHLTKIVSDNPTQRRHCYLLQTQLNNLMAFTDESIEQKKIKIIRSTNLLRT
jgi:CHASE3 domain sensor protein